MDKKLIQEQRMKQYFFQAAMEILRGEGIKSLSVRNVAEKAGYSYATLYNYFKDLNELLSVCIGEFLQENKESIEVAIKYIPKGKERLAVISYTYIKYFIQYPGIFELIYFTKLNGKISKDQIISFLEDICKEDWNHLAAENIYTANEIETKKDSVRYLIAGILVYYNNLHYPSNFDSLQKIVKEQFSHILEM